MDKPCHPFVIRPWKIRQVQRAKWNAPPVKTGKKHGPLDSKGPKIVSSKKTRGQGSRKTV